MPGYQFERESRTPFSEVYTLQADGSDVGRVDIHFTPSGTVQATLCVPAELDDDGVEELIGEIDERLVLTADVYRDDFIVTVWRGAPGGVYSEDMDDEPEDDEEEEDSPGDGRGPLA